MLYAAIINDNQNFLDHYSGVQNGIQSSILSSLKYYVNFVYQRHPSLDFFREIFQVLLSGERPGQGIRKIVIVRIQGISFEPSKVRVVYDKLKKGVSSLSVSCGLKIQSILRPLPGSTLHISEVEKSQAREYGRYSNSDVNEIWLGNDFDDITKVKLLKTPGEIALALVKLFDEYMPIPTTNLMGHPDWKESIFSEMMPTDKIR